MNHNVARHSYCSTELLPYRTETPLHSEFVGRPPATLEKRSPINRLEEWWRLNRRSLPTRSCSAISN